MKDPRLAALMSLIFPGLGQMYNGQKLKGALFSVVHLINFLLIPFKLGQATTPIFWLYAVFDAYRVADLMMPTEPETEDSSDSNDPGAKDD